MKVGQSISTEGGALGVIKQVTSDFIVIDWIKHTGGADITHEDSMKYPRADIDHSLSSGFLSIIDTDDPNIMFLMRKRNVHS